MKIRIEDEIYEGEPEEIAEQLRQSSFYPNEFKNATEYVEHLSVTFVRITDIPCPLPDDTLNGQARAFFEKLAEIDAAEILED